MQKIIVTLISGDKKEFEKGITSKEIAISIKRSLGNTGLAAKVNGVLIDLHKPITEDSSLEIITFDNRDGKEIFWHSTSHIMAQAVQELFPEVKLAIGPAIDQGFYYDFSVSKAFTPEDLLKIENKMHEIVKKDLTFTRKETSLNEALDFFEQKKEKFKIELINDLTDNNISFYSQGDFTDLCRGPHVPSTGKIKYFKLLSVAGAYWRGDEKNEMLQRIYGISFPDKTQLDEYLKMIEEARKRDHRKLGKELELFMIHENVGPGLIIYLPKGALLRKLLEDYEKEEHLRRGYEIVIGPQILSSEVWKISGHYEYYKENMYFSQIDNQEYGIKPMNCPAHMFIYKSKTRSYKELPLRFFELGTVHRHEKSGVLHGLLRVRAFTQDDAHIFCLPEQLHDEISRIIDFVLDTFKIFGFTNYKIEISTRPMKSIGKDEDWERATNVLKEVLDKRNMKYEINEGDGAFYGPKIDIKLLDCLSRSWQCATIQADFALPERFDLTYMGSDGNKYRPVMLHRVIFGSLERFMGILIEHYAGLFPVWLSPTQVIVISININHAPFAEKIKEKLLQSSIRTAIDIRQESISAKIRGAEMGKIPYMLIIGDKEIEENVVSIRKKNVGDIGKMKLEEFIINIQKEIREKK
ncbi:MAG: threonine--tRNA ligase [Candidatus Firestonebacteria bacterium]|nr:threonine--tRNA ligase [Candidatus Firestonebacteria bacterium]